MVTLFFFIAKIFYLFYKKGIDFFINIQYNSIKMEVTREVDIWKK